MLHRVISHDFDDMGRINGGTSVGINAGDNSHGCSRVNSVDGGTGGKTKGDIVGENGARRVPLGSQMGQVWHGIVSHTFNASRWH